MVNNNCRLLVVFLLTFGIVLGLFQHTIAQSNKITMLLAELQESYYIHLKKVKLGIVPLYDNGVNYHIGDVWDSSMTRLLEGSERCFPHLEFRSGPDTIPSLAYAREAAAGFLLALARLFEALASGSDTQTVTVRFDDVVEEVASEGDLVRSFSKDGCPGIAAIINKSKVTPDGVIPVVVGRLLRGKRNISIVYSDTATAQVRADQIAALTATAPVSVQISGALGKANSVTIIDNKAVPIGFAPAFVPIRVAGTNQGSGGQPEYEWRAFEPIANPSQTAAIGEHAKTVQSSWHWNDQ